MRGTKGARRDWRRSNDNVCFASMPKISANALSREAIVARSLFTMPSYLAAWAMPHTSADLLFYCLFAVGLVLGAMLIKLRRILQPPTRACAS